jgi:gas vesicle protein
MGGKFVSGLIIGTTIGLVAGLLAAPSEGKTTRRNIIKKSRGYSQQAIDAVRQYLENLKKEGQSKSTGSDVNQNVEAHGI